MKVLILGVTGMLGSAVFRFLSSDAALDVFGTARSSSAISYFDRTHASKILTNVDVENQDSLVETFTLVRPDVVINCIGLIKQLAEADNPLKAVPINTILPHRIASLCSLAGARLVHVSTDCVFSGARGGYLETDFADANDLYGRTKYLGEVDYPNAITLRTSIIGHELVGQKSLIGWFLAQNGSVKGYRKAIFSGVPTVELSRIIRDFVFPNPKLRGLYHVAAHPIDKFNLLNLVAKTYGKNVDIAPDEKLVIDRSLNASRFAAATGYSPPGWPELVKAMYEFQ